MSCCNAFFYLVQHSWHLHMSDVALLCSLIRGRFVYEKHWETLRFWCAGCSLTVHVVQDFLKEEDKNENETFLQDCLQKWSSKLHNVQKKQFRETFCKVHATAKTILACHPPLGIPFFTGTRLLHTKENNDVKTDQRARLSPKANYCYCQCY